MAAPPQAGSKLQEMQIAQTHPPWIQLRAEGAGIRIAKLINEADEKKRMPARWGVTGVAVAVVVTKGVARDARLKEAAGYIRAPIVHLFNNSRRVRVNSITTTSRSCRNL